jgi:hypothetical protein
VNVLAVELDDDIAWLDGAVVDRPALDDPGDQRARAVAISRLSAISSVTG